MDTLLDMLMRHEGVRIKPYHDTVGKLTIGVGRNLDDVGITRDEAMYLLNNDVNKTVAWLRSTYPWFSELSPVRQDAVTDMAFNLGTTEGDPKFPDFHRFHEALSRHDYKAARERGLDSKWATQVGHRANELMAMIETGQYQT